MPSSSGPGNGRSRTSASVSHASASSFFASFSGPPVRTSGWPASASSAAARCVTRFTRERLGGVVLTAVRRADRRRARLDRLARRGDRDLAGAVLLFERGARRFAERCDLRAAVHARMLRPPSARARRGTDYEDAARRSTQSGAGWRCIERTFACALELMRTGPRPQRAERAERQRGDDEQHPDDRSRCVAIASRPNPPTTASNARNTSRRRFAAACTGDTRGRAPAARNAPLVRPRTSSR